MLTHAHPDHVGSAEHIRVSCATPVRVHELEASHARGDVVEQVSIARLLRMLWRSDVRSWVFDIVRLDARQAARLGAVEAFTTEVLDVPGRPCLSTPRATRVGTPPCTSPSTASCTRATG